MSKSPLAYQPYKGLVDGLSSLARRHPIERVFTDWVEMSALAISNATDWHHREEREARYMQIVAAYDKDEAKLLAEMLGHLVMDLERTEECVFSKLISKLEIRQASARWRAQIFTPFPVSYMMAQMALAPQDKLAEQVEKKGFITLQEPSIGAGGMVLAFARAFREAGFNPHTQLHYTGIDIDPTCVHMSYVQTSLWGIPGMLACGNALGPLDKLEISWFTTFHSLHLWNAKLRRHADLLPWKVSQAPGDTPPFPIEIPTERIAAE